MPANNLPIVPVAPVVGIALSIATNTSRTTVVGTGTNTALTAATTNGLRVDQVVVQLAATSAAAVVFLWMYDGTNQSLIDEFVIPAVTPSNTAAGARIARAYANLVLPPTYRLFVSTTIAQTTHVYALGGSY